MLLVGHDIDGDDPPCKTGAATSAETVGYDETLNDGAGSRPFRHQRACRRHAQESAHLVGIVSDAWDEASLIDHEQALEILRPVLAEGEHSKSDCPARGFLTAVFTDAIDLKVVTGSVKTVFAADLLLQLADLGREEFDRGAAFCAHHVMVAAAVELVLVAGHAVRKRHHAGQPAFGQQFERAVDGGEAYLGVSFLD